MKIIQINSVEGVGSTGRIASGIQRVAINNGHEFINAYGRESNQNNNNIKIGERSDIYKHVMMTRVFDRHGLGSKKATIKFIEDIKKENPDIIHLQNLHGYYINIQILFCFLKNYNKPVVWSLHDCWSFTGHCSHFEYKNCQKWKESCYKCPEKKSYPKSYILDNSNLNFKDKKKIFNGVSNLTIVTGSKWLDNNLNYSFLKDYNRVNIPTGIDLNLFFPRNTSIKKQFGIENKFLIVGVASTWGERKGLDQFIKLSQKIQDDEVILLVGVNKKEKSILPSNIIAVEKTSSIDELANIYSSADVFVNPTLEDTFPTTNLEAQACGTPVITYNTGGSPESVPADCGYITKKLDVDELYAHISKIKKDTKEKYFLSCIENAKKYDMNVIYKKYLNLYEEIVR